MRFGKNYNNKFKKKGDRSIYDIFPPLETSLVPKLMIDEDSLHYISTREQAKNITDIMIRVLNGLNLEPNTLNIIDGTAGVGGNTLSFAKHFNKIYSIEIDRDRYNCLNNNVSLYKHDNITTINENCISILRTFRKCDVIFLDPPWGGKNYKLYRKLRIKLSGIPIETICNNIMNPKMMLCVPKLIVMKLPTNYDYEFLFDNISRKEITVCNIDKMNIVLIKV